jgi:predicted DNA-binding transcriptional regulator YafY
MKNHDLEFGTRTRVIHILRTLAESPNRYTRAELADRHQVHKDTILGDLNAIETAGFIVTRDEKNRYRLEVDKPLKQLKDLLHFSEEDQVLLYQAIDSLPANTDRQQKLKAKLASLYDYGRLGHAYLRKPHLSKVDRLLKAQNEKKQVLLIGYHSSNSNTISDRLVEPFHTAPPEDTLQAFDVDKNVLRHFRISRITRVKETDQDWQFEGHHNILRTDPFRIVNNAQVLVHLRLGVAAYNELLERYPLATPYIQVTDNPDVFDFQCMVNRDYYGLSNFLLGYFHLGIEVVGPDALKDFLKGEVEKMRF